MTSILSIITLAILITGCGGAESASDGKTSDSASKAGGAPSTQATGTQSPVPQMPTAGEATRWDTLPPIAVAPPALQADTIPLRTPEGTPARYGVPSARLFGRFSGDARGTRTVIFDQWGLRERKEENIAPWPETKSVAINNTIFITTRESQAYADMRTRRGFRRAINGVQPYENDPASKTVSFGDWIARRTEARRLEDTVIAGYHTKVFQREQNGVISTIWVWRGLPIRELTEVRAQGVRYLFEPLTIDVGVSTDDTTFQFPAGYEISPYK